MGESTHYPINHLINKMAVLWLGLFFERAIYQRVRFISVES